MKTLKDAENEARKQVNKWMAIAGCVGWMPFSQWFLAPADYKMVEEIAHCFEVTDYNAEAVLTAATASITGKTIAFSLMDFFPAAWVIKGATATGITKGVGELVISYFKKKSVLA